MKKSNRFLLITSLFCTLMLCFSTIAFSAQQVTIPYVISGYGGWWTGIAITNESGTAIDEMKISFTTDTGATGHKVPIIGRNGLQIEPDPNTIPGKVDPAIPTVWVAYETDIATIAGHAMAVDLVKNFYKGDGSKTLPSERGSVTFSHPGSGKFSVTVYIGNPDGGFSFQVFESRNP